MPDIYINLTHQQYKEVERQMRAFEETTHGEGTAYYHKSFAMDVGGIRFEFHGPPVKARRGALVLGDPLCKVMQGSDPTILCDKPEGHPGEHSRAGK
jgi:hypothetical protein